MSLTSWFRKLKRSKSTDRKNKPAPARTASPRPSPSNIVKTMGVRENLQNSMARFMRPPKASSSLYKHHPRNARRANAQRAHTKLMLGYALQPYEVNNLENHRRSLNGVSANRLKPWEVHLLRYGLRIPAPKPAPKRKTTTRKTNGEAEWLYGMLERASLLTKNEVSYLTNHIASLQTVPKNQLHSWERQLLSLKPYLRAVSNGTNINTAMTNKTFRYPARFKYRARLGA